MFGNFRVVELGSYEGYLGNLAMQLGNLIEHLGNLAMDLGNLDDLVVKFGNLV